MTVQQSPNRELAKHSFVEQVKVKDVGIGSLLRKLYEVDSAVTNPVAISQVSQDLVEISTEDRIFLDLMDTETKKIGTHY